MRLLFEIDTKDYNVNGRAFIRPSVRAIIVRDGKIGMVYSQKYNYYKFPGGGIELGESQIHALKREALEEVGLCVIPESVREFGYVRRVQKYHSGDADFFVQDNYYYLCKAEAIAYEQNLDAYEADEGFTLRFVTPADAITTNRGCDHGPKDHNMIERESNVLEIIIKENIL
jgi:8-oxo-dGTP pyrophosphatase MutT (NUDIX family)